LVFPFLTRRWPLTRNPSFVPSFGDFGVMFGNNDTYLFLGETFRLICAFFWLGTYILLIRRGNKDRVLAMPMAALAGNICWEGIFSFIYMPDDPKVLVEWGGAFCLDTLILVQAFRFGRHDFTSEGVKKHWNAILAVSLVTAFVAIMGFTAQFGDKLGWFTGFLQNVLMSILFVTMLIRRDSSVGQSIYIAVGKFLGTFFAFVLALHWSPAFGTAIVDHRLRAPTPMPPMIPWIYPLIFFFDIVYIVLLYRKLKQEGVNPWTRF
jgi:hypothetical protein